MQYISFYKSPLGKIYLTADEEGLVSLGFEKQGEDLTKFFTAYDEQESLLLRDVKRWLDIYFQGKEPDFNIPLHICGSDFQKKVWNILLKIPYGQTVTYGEIAKEIAEEEGIRKMSAQAAGGAVGSNKISIIIPCHRVIGANGNLTGYGSGITRKVKLLKLEGVDTNRMFIPKSHG